MWFFHRRDASIDDEGSAWGGIRKGGEKPKKSDKPTWLSLMIRNFLRGSREEK